MKKYRIFAIVLLLAGCGVVTPLVNSESKNQLVLSGTSNLEFLQTRASSGIGLTLAQIVKREKEKWGEDITLVNVIEQSKITYFVVIPIAVNKYYVYDVVRVRK
jgi:hypothetical protein